ncbi:MAG: potassium/proton antiporter [Ignavibacteriaceae bacterium]|nr:potassium/proton antiporter [Ignavibacteriaceae bacterium]
MQISSENILLMGSLLLLLTILASKTSFKLGIPALIVFLGIGMLAGSDGPGGIYFDDPKLAQFIGIFSLCFILFAGGFETKWESVKPIFWRGISLATIGVFVTALSTGLFLHFVIGLEFIYALLIGSIISSTDAAAVFSILRTKDIGLDHQTRSTLEFESGSNDPMAYILMLACINIITSGEMQIGEQIFFLVKQMVIGGVFGYALGRGGVYLINKINLSYEGLYSVLVTALLLFVFSITDLLGGNGFLAVYLFGVILANSSLIHKKSLVKFFDGIAWMMQSIMFLTLGLLVYPMQILPVLWAGIMISLFLMFVARPAGVMISLLFTKINFREKIFFSWVGLRGAVPIVFATYPYIYGIKDADLIFNVVFFISLSSVLIQGTTLPFFARKMKLVVHESERKKTPLELELSESIKTELMEFFVPHGSAIAGMRIVDLHFPRNAHIAMINRDEKFITPSGNTVLHEGDILIIMAEEKDVLRSVSDILSKRIDKPEEKPDAGETTPVESSPDS